MLSVKVKLAMAGGGGEGGDSHSPGKGSMLRVDEYHQIID